ncbi:alpha-beta hydrolase superfamily lysophospholipase [Clostridium tetanomorphum]|uniref:Alpha/beta hydrolase n=1 Tax=Clostridium tetanomorphum TaxID=1553 RepID=A0A923E7X9_CLOTT|nr:alpha/beta hydrolase [Clostridium tetanomorphum]KAJ49277.1 Lysophospholipase [Clostridium tetanomorphum DSM 665]KAJ53933.1 Lysophospholipase [Clostridium tetanomorphum DSM 665]MBC2398083.1 alpha/beta hydrolase [Clostridium tetanomorphum]MBP1864650.1 alpha-beta hydrolase superfamily lysophospholipase [Clostridium tetanomorphum]NRS84120.1 alpha-beta hydrolase superfamily lysophospholipase [Clostridium tetanomorphum]
MSISLEFKIKTYDGIEIFCKKDVPKDAKAMIVIVHGLCEHLGRYDYFTEKLNEFGYGVYRFDNRGHGKSGGERGYLENFQNFLQDANKIVDIAKEEHKDLPIFMFGHSMGGLITAAYGMKYTNKLKGQILSGAAVIEPSICADLKKDNYFEKHPMEKSPNNLSYLISRDEEVIKDYDKDPLVLKETNLKLLGEAFINGTRWVSDNVKKYIYPCLIMHGAEDKIVSPESSKWLFQNINSKDKTLKIYERCYHEILNEKEEKEEVIENVHKWIKERI